MDDTLIEQLARGLVILETHASSIDDLLLPTQARGGEGTFVSRSGSKPPLSLTFVDLKIEVENVLKHWVHQLVRTGQTEPLPPHTIESCAAWLRVRLEPLAWQPWGEDAACEIIAQAQLVKEAVDPADGAKPLSPPAAGTARVIARWCKHLGHPISRSQLQRLMQTGELQFTVDSEGQKIVKLADAMGVNSPKVRKL